MNILSKTVDKRGVVLLVCLSSAHFLPLPLFAGAFDLPPEIFLASCLSLNDLFFLLIITLNLSKSFKLALLALTANFFAYEVAAHLLFKSYSVASFLNNKLRWNER